MATGRTSHWTTALRRITIVVFVLVAAAFPVAAQVTVRGELTHELELLPGSSHSGSILLQNLGETPVEVKLYQTDYRSEAPGQHYYDDPGSSNRSNADWISISPMRFTVPAAESYTISYVLDVPVDPDLGGSYWSVLMIEPIPADSPESADADPEQLNVGIRTVVRYAFRFITHMGTTGTVVPVIDGAVLELIDSVPTLGISMRGDGTRVSRLETRAELYSEDGVLVASREGGVGTLYPDSSRQFQIPLDNVPPGTYTALVIIDGGDNNVFGASISVQIDQ